MHHIAQERFIASETEAVHRVILARQQGAEKELIASVKIEDGRLVVWSCKPKRFEVSVVEIPVLANMPAHVLAHFEVSRTGSRIHWPDGRIRRSCAGAHPRISGIADSIDALAE